jgi:hypothetical protein
MSPPSWQRWLLFFALLILGFGYIAAYALFEARSENFIIAQRNRAALEFAEAHPASLPATWEFGIGRQENASLGDGWIPIHGHPGVLMTQNNAWVMLVTTGADSDMTLTLQTSLLTTPAAPRNRVEVSLNGEVLGSWERGGADRDLPIDVHVPHSLVRSGQWRLKIHVDRLASRYRPDAGAERNDQYVMLNGIMLRKADGGAPAVETSASAR